MFYAENREIMGNPCSDDVASTVDQLAAVDLVD